MSKLSRLKVNQTLTQYLDENPDIDFTENQIQDIIDLFDRLMNEESNKSKNLFEQESLVTDIANGYYLGETTDVIFRQHGDNKHMNFFDKFLNEGETKKIEEILKEHNLPTSVLRGLKANQDIHLISTVDGNKIEVKGFISPSPDGVKEQNDYLDIYKNGEIIYSWRRNAIEENVIFDYEDFDLDKYYNTESKFVAPKEPPPTKSGKPRKGIYIGTIISSSGEIVTKEKTSRGQIIYRASNGRFTKQ